MWNRVSELADLLGRRDQLKMKEEFWKLKYQGSLKVIFSEKNRLRLIRVKLHVP
jgi:hypothetical protein